MKKLTGIGIIMLMLASLLAGVVSAAAPTFTLPGPADLTVAEGATATFTLVATDAENDPIVYDLTGEPSFVTLSGAIVTVAPGFTAAGTYTIGATATSNADGEVDTESFTVTVTPATPSSSLITVSAVALGSESQSRSNPDADTDADRLVTATTTFTIKNNGLDALTGVTVTPTVVRGAASDYDMLLTGVVPTTLAAGESATVTVTARVPESLDAVDADAVIAVMRIATLNVAGSMAGTSLSVVRDVTMQANNQLQFKKLQVCVNDNCDSVRDGDKVDSIKPGDKIDVTFTVKNRYHDNDAENIDIQDIQASVLISDSNVDVDESEDVGDLGPTDEDQATISFDIEDDADNGDVTMEAWIEGTDENNAAMGELFTIHLKIERERHEVIVRDVRVDPSTVLCGNDGRDSTVALTFDLHNTGRDDENDVRVEVTSSALSVDKTDSDIELDMDDRIRRSYTLVVPAATRPGTYAITVKSYARASDLSDTQDAILTVPNCADSETPDSQVTDNGDSSSDNGEVVVVPAQTVDTVQPPAQGTTAIPVVSTSNGAARTSTLYVAFLVAIIIVLVVIGVMLVNALAKKN